MTRLPDVIHTYLDAYNRKDVEAMLACLAQEVTFQNISDGVITAVTAGRAAFETLARAGAEAFRSRSQRVRHAITVADTTLVEIDYRAEVAMDLPNGWVAGQVLSFQGASAFRVRDDKIISMIDQSDTVEGPT
ncbi:nuclear transport factor 2 family protein [Dinoroseobacter sp. S124A]|uniref:nuclear transport factor 2 family protein n=1 Tax=Dinoroseobacter sp. S124A TaxID=3415128 RepID=UPI003C7C0989